MSARSACCLALTALALGLPAPAAIAQGASRPQAVDTMISSINDLRARRGLPAFRTSPRLLRSARGYASYLMRRNLFSHSGLARIGRMRLKGEALEMHTGRASSARWALGNLLASPPHRAIILSRRFRLVGAGMARGRFRGNAAVIWVLHTGLR